MKRRCLSPKAPSYANYGGRGITVCNQWLTWAGFMQWDKFGDWKEGLQIDRIDNNKGYSPDNCRWVTPTENNRNRRSTKLTDLDVILIRQLRFSGLDNRTLASIFGVSYNYIKDLITFRKRTL